MTIHLLGLTKERFRLSDTKHSEIITKENSAFTLAEGEQEFTIEQLSVTRPRRGSEWGIFLLIQIISALIRALCIRKPIFSRCTPFVLSATVKIAPCRYDSLTLFYTAGGYSHDLHSYQPPVLEGDRELSVEKIRYAVDDTAVTEAIKEEKLSKLGYIVMLYIIPIVLFVVFFATNYGIFFAVAAINLFSMTLITLFVLLHSRHAKKALKDKIADSLRYLNGEI